MGRDEPVFDPAALEQLRQLDDGDGEFLRSAIDLFLADAADRLGDLQAALAERDAAGLERLAHSLKSSSGHFGGQRLAARCAELERAAAGGRLQRLRPLAASIEAELESLRGELEKMRPAPAG